MPQYEIHHCCNLTLDQIDAFALALTKLHCSLFSAPSIFVNVTFHVTQSPSGGDLYGDPQYIRVGGRAVATNYIIGHLRPRGPDNRDKLNTLVVEIMRLWNEHARPTLECEQYRVRESAKGKVRNSNDVKVQRSIEAAGRLDDPRALHNVFIMEDIAAGAEQGFVLPLAGQDGKWVEENRSKFEERAKAGDESMQTLLEEMDIGLGQGPVTRSKL